MIMQWLLDYKHSEHAGTERNRCIFRGVVQLVAHLIWVQEAVGSSPAAPTTLFFGQNYLSKK